VGVGYKKQTHTFFRRGKSKQKNGDECVWAPPPPTGPNLLSGPAHSVNKRGGKRRDLDLEELKEVLSPLLPFVRTEHILPAHSDVLGDAVGASSY